MSELENIVDRLQNKSEKSRRKLLWVSTLSIFTAVSFVWFTTLGISFTDESGRFEAEKVSPFASVGHIFNIVKDDVMLGLGVVQGQAKGLISDTNEYEKAE